jgi:hypothetical protein
MSRRPRAVRNKGVIAAARRQPAQSAGPRLAFRADPLSRRVVRPLLIAALATSVSVALLVIVRIVSPASNWLIVAPLCFLVAIEGTYTAAWLNNPDSHGVDRLAYRAAEVLLIIVVARVYSWVAFGPGIPAPEDVRLFLTAPLALVVTGGFLTTLVATLVAWWLAVSTGQTLAQLDLTVYEINFYTLSLTEQKTKADDRPIQISRDELVRQFFSRWVIVGILMVALAALSTFEVEQFASVANPLAITRLGLGAAMLFALMTYFLAGLWLLSHARLLRMNARWLIDGAAKDVSLDRGWQRGALLVLSLIALVAAFLPIGSTLAISRILSIGLSGLAYLAGRLFALLGYLFGSVLLALTRNIEQSTVERPEFMPLPPPPPPAAAPPGQMDPLFGMLVSSAFWALFIALIIGASLFFLRERGYRIEKTRVQGIWLTAATWLRERWARLTGRARRFNQEWRARLSAARPPSPPGSGTPAARPRFIRLGALPPREQVRYYYLALVRRAGERGIRRGPSETPLEFGRSLKAELPDAQDDVDELTGAFLRARYSPQPIDRVAAGSVKARWNRLKAQLRARATRGK